MTEIFDPNKTGGKKEEAMEAITDPWDPRLEADPDLVTGRLINNFRFIMPGGPTRNINLAPELVYKSFTKRQINRMRKEGNICDPQETFRSYETRLIRHRIPNADPEFVKNELSEVGSDKRLDTVIRDFYQDIDKAIAECGLDPADIEKRLKEAKTEEEKMKLNDLILVVYKKLRKDYGYSHRDLIS